MMCKHLGKFLLSIDEERATIITRRILKELEDWSFNAPDNQTS